MEVKKLNKRLVWDIRISQPFLSIKAIGNDESTLGFSCGEVIKRPW